VPGDPFGPAGCIGSHGYFVPHATRKSSSRGERVEGRQVASAP